MRATDGEVASMARHLGLSTAGMRKRHAAPGPEGTWLLKQRPDGACALLEHDVDGRAVCAVYPVRPRRCAEFPFWDELREPGPALAAALRFCPGLTPATRSV